MFSCFFVRVLFFRDKIILRFLFKRSVQSTSRKLMGSSTGCMWPVKTSYKNLLQVHFCRVARKSLTTICLMSWSGGSGGWIPGVLESSVICVLLVRTERTLELGTWNWSCCRIPLGILRMCCWLPTYPCCHLLYLYRHIEVLNVVNSQPSIIHNARILHNNEYVHRSPSYTTRFLNTLTNILLQIWLTNISAPLSSLLQHEFGFHQVMFFRLDISSKQYVCCLYTSFLPLCL